MQRLILVCLPLLAAGCFFEKETAHQGHDLHQGGTIMLDKCGYSVSTADGASVPEPSSPVLGKDPTPKFVHVNVGQDPRTGAAILWRTNDETSLATTVQFGVNGATDQSESGFTFVYDLDAPTSTGLTEVRMHETHLCGLTPDTEYTYRVGGIDQSGTESWSPTYTFRTLPMDPSAPMTILVIGDTRDGYSEWGTELKQAFATATPDIILFSGDGTTLGPIQDEWEAWFMAVQDELPLVPMILAHGNHDVSSVNWFSQFAMPGDEQNFAVQFGGVHLTVANDTPINPADLTGSILQTLDTNLKAGIGQPWNILMHHKPMYSAAAGPHPEDVTTMRADWLSTVDSDQVDVVFNGHDHDYERSKPMHGDVVQPTTAGATVYFVVGAAGADLYDSGSSYWTAFSEKTYCYAVIRIMPGSLQMTAYRDDGSMLDSTMITK
ncbi:MAG TPA: metallophosphoesterase family protein [Polyangia bacterium]|jgi:predicted phosphodiesterase